MTDKPVTLVTDTDPPEPLDEQASPPLVPYVYTPEQLATQAKVLAELSPADLKKYTDFKAATENFVRIHDSGAMTPDEYAAFRAFRDAAADLQTVTAALPIAQEKFRAALAALAEVAAPTKAP